MEVTALQQRLDELAQKLSELETVFENTRDVIEEEMHDLTYKIRYLKRHLDPTRIWRATKFIHIWGIANNSLCAQVLNDAAADIASGCHILSENSLGVEKTSNTYEHLCSSSRIKPNFSMTFCVSLTEAAIDALKLGKFVQNDIDAMVYYLCNYAAIYVAERA